MSDKITVELSEETYNSLKSQIEEKESELKEKKKGEHITWYTLKGGNFVEIKN